VSTGEAALGSAELRALVREVLLATIPGGLGAAATSQQRAAESTDQGPDSRLAHDADMSAGTVVTVTTDAELAVFVERIARECCDRDRREDLMSGRSRFTLAGARAGAAAGTTAGGEQPPATIRIERGAVTERQVREASRCGATIVAARGVVITPLARDRARTSGVDIEKER